MSVEKGLLAIASEVLSDVQKEADAIIQDAEKQAKETLQAAKRQAEQEVESIIYREKTNAENDRQKIVSITEVEMRNQLLKKKEEIVDVAFNKAVVQLKDYVKSEKYHAFLFKSIEDGATKIDSKNLVIFVNKTDRAWLNQESFDSLRKKIGKNIVLSDETIDCIGGCTIQTVDGKILFNSTIDNRLDELKPELRAKVAKMLFEKEE